MNQQQVQVARYTVQKKKQEVITSKNFQVTLSTCNLSKSVIQSPINKQVLSKRAIYLNI